MTLNEYQQAAMRTASGLAHPELLMNAALGICGEGGEVADPAKKKSCFPGAQPGQRARGERVR